MRGLVLILIVVITSCSPALKSNATFRLSGCDASVAGSPESVQASVLERDLMLRHNAVYPCCADIKARLVEGEGRLDVYEENTAETCGCLCTYAIDTSLLNIAPGNYTLVLHGVGHEGSMPGNITYTRELTIPTQEAWEDALD